MAGTRQAHAVTSRTPWLAWLRQLHLSVCVPGTSIRAAWCGRAPGPHHPSTWHSSPRSGSASLSLPRWLPCHCEAESQAAARFHALGVRGVGTMLTAYPVVPAHSCETPGGRNGRCTLCSLGGVTLLMRFTGDYPEMARLCLGCALPRSGCRDPGCVVSVFVGVGVRGGPGRKRH